MMRSTLATAETFHFTVRIGHGAASRPSGTLQLARIIGRAIPYAALDVSMLIPRCAASRFGTKHRAVLIHCALAFSAYYISVLVLDAIRSIDLDVAACRQD
jgi:hypothetical protein